MSYTQNLWLFAVFVFGIILVPGMDMMIALSHALSPRRGAGYAALAGIVTGGMMHSVYAALGVGLILAVYPAAYFAVLVAGCAYVAWIGLQLARSNHALGAVQAAGGGLPKAYRDGFVTCMGNPKAYLFMLAVYPQFISPQFGSIASQAAVLAAIILAVQLTIYGVVVISAGAARNWLAENPAAQMRLTRIVGWTMLGVAAWTLLHGIQIV